MTGSSSASGLRVGVLGASGYGGAGLIERLMRHPHVRLAAIGSRAYLGQPLSASWPHLAGLDSPLRFASSDDVIAASDVVFCATPHGATAPLVAQAVAEGKRVIDMSADFRLDAREYEEWYGAPHPHPELLADAVYGMVELHRNELPGARIVASPGCNATAASLALAPLAAAGLIGDAVIVNVLTGVSGAGRGPSQAMHYSEMNENARPYKPAGTHRHTAEIEAVGGRARAAAARGNGKELLAVRARTCGVHAAHRADEPRHRRHPGDQARYLGWTDALERGGRRASERLLRRRSADRRRYCSA